jgi:hypothetical protein
MSKHDSVVLPDEQQFLCVNRTINIIAESFGKNESPTSFWYDTDRLENEKIRMGVTQTHSKVIS